MTLERCKLQFGVFGLGMCRLNAHFLYFIDNVCALISAETWRKWGLFGMKPLYNFLFQAAKQGNWSLSYI